MVNQKLFSRPKKPLILWLIALISWGLFDFIIIQLKIHFQLGFESIILLLIPTLAFSWSLGKWKGFFLTISGLFLLTALQIILGINTIKGFLASGEVIQLISLGVISILIGRIGELTRKYLEHKADQTHMRLKHETQHSFLCQLNEIVLSSLEPGNASDRLNNLACRLVDVFSADECIISVWNEEKKAVEQLSTSSLPGKQALSESHGINETGITTHVLDTGHPLLFEGIGDSPFLNPSSQIKSYLALPLISEGKNLGGIFICFHSSRKFSDQEKKWGDMVAKQVSLAFNALYLLEESADHLRELDGIRKIYQVINYPKVISNNFGKLTEVLANLLDARICMLGLLKPDTKELIVQSSAFGLEDDQIHLYRFILENEGVELDFSNKEAYFTNSAASIPFPFSEISLNLQVDAFMAVPIFQEDRSLLGFILILNKAQGFTDEDLGLMTIFSDHVSLVIRNLRMFSSELNRNEELSVLNELSNVTKNASNEDELIEFVTQMIGEKLFPDNFGVLMLDEDQENLVLHSSYRMGKEEIETIQPIELGIAGFVVRTGTTRRENDIRLADDYLTKDDQTLSELCVPLKIGDQVFGVVNAESSRLNDFSKQDEDLLNIISGQLSSAIERLRSDEELRTQTLVLARSNALINALAQVSTKASRAVNPDGVMHTLGNELATLGLYCVIALPRSDHHQIHIVYSSIPEKVIKVIERVSKKKLEDFIFSPDQFWEHPLGSMDPLFLHDPANVVSYYLKEIPRESVQRILAPTGVTSSMPICQIPLSMDGVVIGYIWLWGEDLYPGDMPTMSIFGNQVAIALQNARLMEEVRKMAITDELTNIYNRRYFFEIAEREFNRAKRYDLPLSVIFLDLDNFKQINDTYGHNIGDQILRNVSQLLNKNIREHDTLGRYGGEEFTIILPLTKLTEAHELAMRLKMEISEHKTSTDAGLIGVKISSGVAQITDKIPTVLSLIQQADKAMYVAKKTGGDCVAKY